MTRNSRVLAMVFLVLTTMFIAGCDETGVGLGMPASGSHWGGGGTTPGIHVAGGPTF